MLNYDIVKSILMLNDDIRKTTSLIFIINAILIRIALLRKVTMIG